MGVRVFLVDGTYELFRQHFGRPPRAASDGAEVGAVTGALTSLSAMLVDGVTHLGVATDHVIESFRNAMWPTYKDGSGVDPLLLAQFPLLEKALGSLGVLVWPMIELEADDALASAAAVAREDPLVDQVLICTPDKDLAQCVQADRVVQLDRRSGQVSGRDAVVEKFGVEPSSIPDWLALVGDSADGFPGISGWGKRSASVVLSHYGHLEAIPERALDWDPSVRTSLRGADRLAAQLQERRDDAFLFRDLATLREEPTVLSSVAELAWSGPDEDFAHVCAYLRVPELVEKMERLGRSRA